LKRKSRSLRQKYYRRGRSISDLNLVLQQSGIFSNHPDGSLSREFVPFNESLFESYLQDQLCAGAISASEVIDNVISYQEDKNFWALPNDRDWSALLPLWRPKLARMGHFLPIKTRTGIVQTCADHFFAYAKIAWSGKEVPTHRSYNPFIEDLLFACGAIPRFGLPSSVGDDLAKQIVAILPRMRSCPDSFLEMAICATMIESESSFGILSGFLTDRSLIPQSWTQPWICGYSVSSRAIILYQSLFRSPCEAAKALCQEQASNGLMASRTSNFKPSNDYAPYTTSWYDVFKDWIHYRYFTIPQESHQRVLHQIREAGRSDYLSYHIIVKPKGYLPPKGGLVI